MTHTTLPPTEPAAVSVPPATSPRPLVPQFPKSRPAWTLLREPRTLLLFCLGLVALALALAAIVEANHGPRAAREMVLDTRWFTLLRLALAGAVVVVGIHHGFQRRLSITAVILGFGLLLLIGGDLLTTLLASESRMALADTREPAVHQVSRTSHRGEFLQAVGQHRLEVFRVPSSPTPSDPVFQSISKILSAEDDVLPDDYETLKDHYVGIELRPGVFPWRDGADEALPASLRWLRGAGSSDGPRTLSLGAGRLVTLEDFQPATEQQPFADSLTGDFAALQLRWSEAASGSPRSLWLTSQIGRSSPSGPLALTLLELDEPALLPEFTQPPSLDQLGQKGQLVVALGRRGPVHRFALDALPVGKAVAIPDTELQLTVKRHGELFDLLTGLNDSRSRRPTPRGYPSVLFEVTGPEGTGEFIACARAPQVPAYVRGETPLRLSAWLHAPDFRFDGTTEGGAIHFLYGPDRQLWQRTFSPEGRLLSASPIRLGESLNLPTTGAAALTPLTWRPRAVARPSVVPVAFDPRTALGPGQAPALLCRLRVGNQSEQTWVRLGARATGVKLNDELYFVRYRARTAPAGFALTLHEGPARADANRLTLTRRENGVDRTSDHTLASDRPLRFGSLTVTPAGVRPLTRPETGQELVDSTGRRVQALELAIRRDPGQPFIFAGALVLICGILLALAGEAAALVGRSRSAVWAGGYAE